MDDNTDIDWLNRRVAKAALDSLDRELLGTALALLAGHVPEANYGRLTMLVVRLGVAEEYAAAGRDMGGPADTVADARHPLTATRELVLDLRAKLRHAVLRNARLTRENAELRDALRPFAEYGRERDRQVAERCGEVPPDGFVVAGYGNGAGMARVTIGHCRAARRELERGKETT